MQFYINWKIRNSDINYGFNYHEEKNESNETGECTARIHLLECDGHHPNICQNPQVCDQ